MEKRSPDVAVVSNVHPGAHGCHAKAPVNYLKNISLIFLFSTVQLLLAVNSKTFNNPKNYSL
jgi:hypothetical protein